MIVFGRAMLPSSRQLLVQPVPPVAIDAHAAADRLAGAVKHQTISHQDIAETNSTAFLHLHEYLERTYPKVHEMLKRETIGRFSLLYTWPGRNAKLRPLLLLAHLDVVPVEPETIQDWVYPPFAGVIADNFVWGRGAIDCKAGVSGMLEAVEYLLGQRFSPARTVMLAFGHDEEVGGGQGAAAIARLLTHRGVYPELILDEGLAVLSGIIPGSPRPVASIGIAEKGYLTLELVATGEGGHASMPPRQPAVGILTEALQALQAHPPPSKLEGPSRDMLEFLGPEMPFLQRTILRNLWLFGPLVEHQLDQNAGTRAMLRTTLAPTMLEASKKENVLSQQARAVLNIRVHPSDRVATVMAFVERTIGDRRVTVKVRERTVREPSSVSSIEGQGFQVIQRTISEVFPDALVAPGLVLGGTDSHHYASLSEHIYRFIPVPFAKEDLPRLHGINERLAIEAYLSAVTFYAALIKNTDELPRERLH